MFSAAIVGAGGRAGLYSIWPTIDRRQDFARAIESYQLAADDVDGVFLPVATAWLAAWDIDANLSLYSDGLHASVEGTALLATHTQPPTRTLAAPDWVINHEFRTPVAVRELPDGRVLIADRRALQIVVADRRRNTVRQVSRSGQGPGEYRTTHSIFGVGGDTTILVDPIQRRWITFVGDSAIASLSRAFDSLSLLTAVARSNAVVLSLDVFGNALVMPLDVDRPVPYEIGPADSLAVALLSRRSGRADTVTHVLMAPIRREALRNSSGEVSGVRTIRPPWSVQERAVLCENGWLGLVRLNPYRVEWRSPTGSWQRMAPLSYTATRATSQERMLTWRGLLAANNRNQLARSRTGHWRFLRLRTPSRFATLRGAL